MNFEKVDVHEKALSLPAQPGVYLMLDKNHEVIYVGKAKKLINRVSSYFRENPNHNYKTQVMVKQVWDFDYIVTDTEFEALVLENSLIKRHMPKYNILLKDDKGYPFIRLGIRDEYPNFSIVSKPLNDKARYFGPYSSRGYSKQAIEAVRVALGLPSCSRKFPRDIGKGRPCLNYHLGKCSAVCSGKVSREEYQAMIDRAVMIFEGKLDQIVEDMKRRMDKHAENLEFEQAAKLRDQISAISRLGVRQKVMSGMLSDTDVLALYTGASKTAFAVLHYIEGALLESEVHLMDTPVHTDRAELMDGFLKQYYMPRKVFPKNIYVSDAPEDLELLEQWLSEIGGARVYIAAPQRGDKLKMVEMAGENARQKVLLSESKEEVANRAITDLQKLLGLSEPPRRVESYDISNTAGKEIVGSMVVYQDGEPRRRDYRRFQIKSLADQDDCAAMREMLERRMLRMQAGDEKFSVPPDLILLDGGRTQTNAVWQLFQSMGIAVPVFGMVKDDRHRTRAIVNHAGEEIGIQANPAVFRMVGNIQEEVHRFAIEYHRKLRGAGMSRSSLEEIPGVGKVRAGELLRAFKSLTKIKNASAEELMGAVPRDVAARVYAHFHPQSQKGEIEDASDHRKRAGAQAEDPGGDRHAPDNGSNQGIDL